MEAGNLYKVLGVSKGASQEEIRRSYRKLAREHHPDANRDDPKAEERFKEIQHAYEILSNPKKRRQYDEGPRTFFGGGNAPQGNSGGARTGDFSDPDLSDLFGGFGGLGDIFGRSARARETSSKGQSVTMSVNLSFKDALNGVTTRVNVPVEEACGDCRGTGAVPGGGHNRREALPYVFWEWKAAQGASGHGKDSGGGQRRNEDPGPWSGERRQEGWGDGRPICGDAGGGAFRLQAAWGRLHRRGAGQLRGGGARRGDRGTPTGGWDGEVAVAGGDAGWQAVQGAWCWGAEGAGA